MCDAVFTTTTREYVIHVHCLRRAGHAAAGDSAHQGKVGRHLVRWR